MKRLIRASESAGAYSIENIQSLIKELEDEYGFTVYLSSKGAVIADRKHYYCMGAYLRDLLKYLQDIYGDVDDLEGMDVLDAFENAGEEFVVPRYGDHSSELHENTRKMKQKYLR